MPQPQQRLSPEMVEVLAKTLLIIQAVLETTVSSVDLSAMLYLAKMETTLLLAAWQQTQSVLGMEATPLYLREVLQAM